MSLKMGYDIQFEHEGKTFKLALLHSVEIESDVEVLGDNATIRLPEFVLNNPQRIQEKIGRGAKVQILLGYNDNLRNEFEGYVREITTHGSSLNIECEDALFLFRVDVDNEELKSVTTSDICKRLIQQVDPSFKLVCDFDIGWEKFTINEATAFDVLKKIAEQTKANIYFNTAEKELHVHFPYKDEAGRVTYAFNRNIEESSLEYQNSLDHKVQINVESINKSGEVRKTTKGTSGGNVINIKVGGMSKADIDRIADAELIRRSGERYEGSFQTWLDPYVRPAYTARMLNELYPNREGDYYVKSVFTSFSDSGGIRNVGLAIRLN